MASVPNTRMAPAPVPAGKPPAAAGANPAGFAQQLAEIPEELLRLAASILSGDGDAPTPDAAQAAGKDEATAEPAAPSDAAQLAALAPMLQPLPAILPVSAFVPPAAAADAEPAAKATAVAAQATPPAPTAVLPAPAQAPPGKGGRTQPQVAAGTDAEADADAPSPDSGHQHAAPALDVAAKEAIAAAKRAIDAAARLTRSAIDGAAPKLAPPMARLAASVLETVKTPGSAAPALDLPSPTADVATSTAFAVQSAPAPAAAAPAREPAAPAPDRNLDLVNDAEWIDRLARDIAQATGNEGAIRFRLHPQTLGHLQVELSQGEHGTSIRLTADTEHARSILADAQPRLAAEARAQGVRIAETHVDLSGSDRQASSDPRRQDELRQTPLIRTARDAATGEDSPERPRRSKSDRYA